MGRYTTEALVAQRLDALLAPQDGGTFTDVQNAECTLLIDAAEDWLDRQPGGPWLASTALTDEQHIAQAGTVVLYRSPVASIQGVTIRSPHTISAVDTTLTNLSGYELLDAEHGILLVAAADGVLVEVDYTPARTAPDVINRAATELTAAWLAASIQGQVAGTNGPIASYSIGQEIQIRYDTGGSQTATTADGQPLAIPPIVTTLLRSVMPATVFA